jgi:hypothetical protein
LTLDLGELLIEGWFSGRRRGGFRQLVAAVTAKLETRGITKTTLRTDHLYLGPTFDTELQAFGVFKLTVGAFHIPLPICRRSYSRRFPAISKKI